MWKKDTRGHNVWENTRNATIRGIREFKGKGDSRLHAECGIDYRAITETLGYTDISDRLVERELDQFLYENYESRERSQGPANPIDRRNWVESYKSIVAGESYSRYSGIVYDVLGYISREINRKISAPVEILRKLYQLGGVSDTFKTAVGTVLLSSRAWGDRPFMIEWIECPTTRYCLRNWGRAKQRLDNDYPVFVPVALPSGEEVATPFHLNYGKHYPEYMTSGWSSEKIVDHLKKSSESSDRIIEYTGEELTRLFGVDSEFCNSNQYNI